MNIEGPVLRDIHLPTAGWWPLAPGWWLLALFVTALAACAVWWLRRRKRRVALRDAMREIDALESAYEVNHDVAQLADSCSRLLRRVARRIDPAAASRTGAAWREFLHRHARDAATRQALDDLRNVRFRANPRLDATTLFDALRTWCRAALRQRPARRPDAGNAMQQVSP